MKTILLTAFVVISSVVAVHGQGQIDRNLRTQSETGKEQTRYIVRESKPNLIRGEKLSYSGVLVQLRKTDNPLQLINPFAPAAYGSARDNLHTDPITSRPTGISLFSIHF